MNEMGHMRMCGLPGHKEFMVIKHCLTYLWLVVGKWCIATQFVMGENYWSQVHYDNDKFLCLLSVLPNKHQDDDKIMNYFVFRSILLLCH